MIEEGCATDTPRKRILIVNNNMHIGGVQKALVNLLKEIASEYEVTFTKAESCCGMFRKMYRLSLRARRFAAGERPGRMLPGCGCGFQGRSPRQLHA